ncbi:SDR family NAD(P)-dependent oxidoreductase [Butyricimonas sp. Marseille-P3923]|uniref:SDR family NAD(P)-dependent oxidoreductase n=1 Tax=Butyricimonas sp. Marseille-P3923 TaxID=1987504 RepID=UPI000C074DB7|nr:SDR family oxidoreductase [Butyricimonas sp. Marseille-P3923]
MKTCVITGTGSGIGREVAILLSHAKEYEHIAMLGRNVEAMKVTENLMDETGKDISVWDIDFQYPEKIPAIIEAIYEKYGSIDCLLNIAGYTDPQSLLQTTLDNMEMTYKVNVFSPFLLIRESVKYMKKSGGKILNVASTAGMTPRPGWLSYSSSKASIISMSQTLTDELSEYGIKVYCVSPGRCATKLRKRLAPNEDPTTIMQPQDVAEVICNLISNEESCLDGQNIVIRKQIKKH